MNGEWNSRNSSNVGTKRLNDRKWKTLFCLLSFSLLCVPLPAVPDNPADDADLKDNLDFLQKDAQQMVESKFDQLGKPADRDFHSRGVCLKGTFETFPENVPAETAAQVPFFSTKGKYAMYGRFSNGFPGRDSNDHIPSVFGFGVKVIGVPGKKFDMQSLGSTKPVNNNQDWNMATGATFAIPTAALYREFRERGLEKFALSHPEIAWDVGKGLIHIDAFQTISYHSQVALHFGEDYVAKFSAGPCDQVDKKIGLIKAELRTKTYTTDNLVQDIKTKGFSFCFWAQVRPADEKLPEDKAAWATKYPRDNPSILWPEKVIPSVKIAEITFRAQPDAEKFEKLQELCKTRLSFNPGNTLQQLRPIESDTLMRSRFLAAYEGSVTKRTSLNHLPAQWEPEPVAPEMLEKWLNE